MYITFVIEQLRCMNFCICSIISIKVLLILIKIISLNIYIFVEY